MPDDPRPRRAIDPEPDPVPPADPGGAEPAGPAPAPRTSHLRAFLRPSRGQLVVAAVLALTAMLVVVTLRSQGLQPAYNNLRREELIQLLDNLSGETRRLETELRELQTTRDELASGAQGAQAAEAEARRRLETLEIIGGTVPAHGSGIRLTIEDPAGRLSPELLLDGLEELRDAGAEVIEFDDTVRVVASTWVGLDDRGRIVVDGHVLSVPVVIDVIGDPPTLEAGARFRGGLVSQVEGDRVGGRVRIEQLDDVVIDSVVPPRVNRFAVPN